MIIKYGTTGNLTNVGNAHITCSVKSFLNIFKIVDILGARSLGETHPNVSREIGWLLPQK